MTRPFLAGAFSLALLGLAAIGSSAAAQDAFGDPDVTAGDPFAIVNFDGTLQDGRRIVSTASLGQGLFEVITNRNITRCACLITLGNPGSVGALEGFGTCVERTGSAGRGWFIEILDHEGVHVSAEFTILGACRP